MSSDRAYVALRLVGPLQSWGFESLYNNRNTGLFPSKSALAGIICAALGYERGSQDEKIFLADFAATKMLSIRLPRLCNGKEVTLSRLSDYHTVQGTRKADGKIKESHITHRQYLQDVSFGVVIEGSKENIEKICIALKNPRWGLWLGRKSCIPSEPIFAGMYGNREDAVSALTKGLNLNLFTYQEDADRFEDGADTLCDVAVSFDSKHKSFAPRRIRVQQGKK